MSVNASRYKALRDTDASVVLRDVADGAETSTATETAVGLNELDLAYWQDGKEIPYGVLHIVIHVTALDATTGDETYTLSLIVDDALAMNDSPVTVWSQAIANTFTGVLDVFLDTKNIPKLDTDSSGTEKYLAVKATLGGTTPSLTYGAFIHRSWPH